MNKRNNSTSLQLGSTTNLPTGDIEQCSTSASQLRTNTDVLAYVRQLDDHRKKCELSGRYSEAAAAATRIKELRVSEAERLRGLLTAAHQAELVELQDNFQQESLNFDASWRAKVTDYEAAVATQLCSLKQQHETQMTEMLMRCEAGRPSRPQHSAEILNGRKIEEALVKQGEYRRAHEVKLSTDALYETELAATHQAWELVIELKKNKLLAKQQGEFDAFLARAARGRNELELSRRDEAEKRQNRFRTLVQEFDGMHRLEMLHLQAYLDNNQALVSPYEPLRDTNLRRKRELLKQRV